MDSGINTMSSEFVRTDYGKPATPLGSLGSYIASILNQPEPDNAAERMREIVDVLSRVDTSTLIKQKRTRMTTLSYLSWAKAWEVILKYFPSASNDVILFNGLPYWDLEPMGCFVVTSITINGITRYMWLPLMDAYNESAHIADEIKGIVETNKSLDDAVDGSASQEGKKKMFRPTPITTTLLNKSIMRCLVKNAAMFGLGLNLYNGEDLPEAVREERERDAEEERKLKVMQDRVIKLGKAKYAAHKSAVQEIIMKHNNGSANPAEIESIEVCETIIKELNALQDKEDN